MPKLDFQVYSPFARQSRAFWPAISAVSLPFGAASSLGDMSTTLNQPANLESRTYWFPAGHRLRWLPTPGSSGVLRECQRPEASIQRPQVSSGQDVVADRGLPSFLGSSHGQGAEARGWALHWPESDERQVPTLGSLILPDKKSRCWRRVSSGGLSGSRLGIGPVRSQRLFI
ncbi:hypothetical protein B0H63DRAFT_201792 [Podospora didyma]|uniref:Uncharacterized protein n=1 Tax=Podospora didyma TaxID=330526 RepID=A0AAE0TVY4_9PEZI|nr:hypothetical protein B0H63DRAFT_201792 [Podospora didyma]